MKNYVFHVKSFYNNSLLKIIFRINYIVSATQRFFKRNHQIRHVKSVVQKKTRFAFAQSSFFIDFLGLRKKSRSKKGVKKRGSWQSESGGSFFRFLDGKHVIRYLSIFLFCMGNLFFGKLKKWVFMVVRMVCTIFSPFFEPLPRAIFRVLRKR